MWLHNVTFEDRLIENERLDLSAKDTKYHLGPQLTLRHCTLVLRAPARHLHLTGAQLVDCTLEVKRELRDFAWLKASLKGCRFTGRLTGNDFGHWPDARGLEQLGEIEGCDFTLAVLDACRFIGCDTRTLRFPSWPCFTLLNPYRRQRELAAVAWPGKVGIAMNFSRGPESTVAVTYLATTLAERFGTTEQELKTVLAGLEGVHY